MGLFSSTYKYYAYAGTSFLLPAESREHTVKSLMLQAGISGTSSLAEAIKMGLQTDMYRRAMKMAKYAADPDGYPYGFPSKSVTQFAISWETLEPFVEADVGYPVGSSAFQIGDPADHTVFWIENGIDTNYMSWFTGPAPTENWYFYPDTVPIPVINPDTSNYYLANNKNYGVAISGQDVTITWHYTDNLGAAQTWVAPSFNKNQPTGGDWLILRWRNEANPVDFGYWFYEIGSGVNPGLEDAIETIEYEGEYLPIAVLMHDTKWFDELVPANPILEKGLDRLLKYISLDPWDVKEDFIDGIENPPPDTPANQVPKIEDIWDFFIHFSVPLRTTDRAAREYLWRYYKHLQLQTWTTFEQYNSWVTTRTGPQPHSTLAIEEGEEYTGYIARYAWSYISEKTYSGEFTPDGWDRTLKTREVWTQEYKLGSAGYSFGLDLVHGSGNYNIASAQAKEEEHTYTIAVRQNKLSEGVGLPTYTAVLMMGPSMEYQINTSSTPVGVGSTGYIDYRYRFVDVKIFPEDVAEDSEFRWPVNIGVLKQISAMRREPVLQEGLAATVFLVDKVKVKWYQKTFFKWLIIIIVIIVIIVTYQYQLLGTVSTMAEAAFLAGATGTAIAFAALYVTMVFALGFLISFAGSLIGGPWGQLFVILATIYLAGGTSMFSNIGTSWGNMAANFGWGTATSFLQSIGPILQTTQIVVENRTMAKYEDKMRNLTATAREKQEELQNAWDELGAKPSWLDPLDLVSAFRAQWYVEKPENYFQRTLNANPGILGYDVVNRFSELALNLPNDGNPAEFINGIFMDMERQRGAE